MQRGPDAGTLAPSPLCKAIRTIKSVGPCSSVTASFSNVSAETAIWASDAQQVGCIRKTQKAHLWASPTLPGVRLYSWPAGGALIPSCADLTLLGGHFGSGPGMGSLHLHCTWSVGSEPSARVLVCCCQVLGASRQTPFIAGWSRWMSPQFGGQENWAVPGRFNARKGCCLRFQVEGAPQGC